MKKYILAWVTLKLLVLAGFWVLAFSSDRIAPAAACPITPTPTATPAVADDSIDRPTSSPFKGDLSRFDREGRAERLQIKKVMEVLGITAGSTVADIGAGSGWFTLLAAGEVGENGRVYAVDISEASIRFIEDKLVDEKISNVKTVLGKPDDPSLPEIGVDAVLILNTYHEIAEPVVFLKNLRKALTSKSLTGIIDRDGKGGDHGVSKEAVIEEAKRAGFELKEEHDFVKGDKMDYFLIFRPANELR